MSESPDLSAVKRIVILAPNWLGDVIMASPMLSYLRRADWASPRSLHITWAVRRAWAPLFTEDPRIDKLAVVERKGRHRGLKGLMRWAREVRALDPDAVLLGPPSLRAALVACLAGAPTRIGYRSDGRSLLLRPGLRQLERGQEHFTVEMMRLAATLLERWGIETPDLPSASARPTGTRHRAPLLPTEVYLPSCAALAPEISDGPGLWAIGPGTTFGPAKNWPVEQLAELLREAVLRREQRVVLLGDAGAATIVRQLQDASGLAFRKDLSGPAGVVDLCGRTDLLRLVAILKTCEGFVGNDSGLMHLAGALGTPTVGIFGSSNPDWTGPAGATSDFVVAEGFPCRPCYLPECNQTEFCLATIDPEQVLARLDDAITRRSGERTS